MKRRLFNLAAAVSLVLCLATVALWCRSIVREDHWYALAGQVPAAEFRIGDGHALVRDRRVPREALADDRIRWYHKSFSAPSVTDKVMLWQFQGRSSTAIALRSDPDVALSGWTLRLRIWPIVAMTSLLPALWTFLTLRRRQQYRQGLCPVCGYDLRASPDCCPECGTHGKMSG